MPHRIADEPADLDEAYRRYRDEAHVEQGR
jgi:hypothetical protein